MIYKPTQIVNMDAFDLIPQEALAVVNARFKAAIIGESKHGKYERWDWLTNVPYSRQDILDKIGRHLTKRCMGQIDDEHGGHVAAIVANGLMLLQYEIDNLGIKINTQDMAAGMHVGRRSSCVDRTNQAEEGQDVSGPPSCGGRCRDSE